MTCKDCKEAKKKGLTKCLLCLNKELREQNKNASKTAINKEYRGCNWK